MHHSNFLLLLFLFLSACAPIQPSLTPALIEPVTPGATPAEITSGPLVLRIDSPQEGAVVSTPVILISGEISEDGVITINEEIYIVSSGKFFIEFPLEEGPNALEIVASDFEGNEVTLVLTLTYQP